MVYVTNVFVDWLTCVAPDMSKESYIYHFLPTLDYQFVKGGTYGLTHATQYSPYKVVHHFTPNSALPSVMVVGGESWTIIRETYGEVDALKIARLFSRHCDHITRIDLSCDIFDGGDLAHEIAHCVGNSSLGTGRRKVRVHYGENKADGCTTYIGARTSPAFLRIYDKNSESKGREPCTRLEFELKASHALAVAGELARFNGHLNVSSIFVSLLLQFMDTSLFDELDKLTYGDVQVLDIPKRAGKLKWEEWMTRQVIPSFDPFKHPEASDRIAWLYDKLMEYELR